MDKIATAFTKLKSDFYLRLEALAQEQNKSGGKIREIGRILEDVSKYVGELN